MKPRIDYAKVAAGVLTADARGWNILSRCEWICRLRSDM